MFAFIFWSSGFCQSGFEVGVTSGVELNFPSSFNSQLVKDFTIQPGFNFGVRFQHTMTDNISWFSGLEYGRMYYYKEEYPAADPVNPIMPDYYILTANQLRIPLLFQYSVGKSRSRVFLNAGFCFLASFQDDSRALGWFFKDGKYIAKDFPREVLLAYNVGSILSAGYSYQLSPKTRFFTELMFMLPLVPNQVSSQYQPNTIRSLNLNLTVGFSFKSSIPK